MAFVILNWIYIFVTIFLCGFAFRKLIERTVHYQINNIIEILFFGLAATTVYAQFFSLFGGVGIAANVFLVMTCILIFLAWRKEILDVMTGKWKAAPVPYKITAVILMLAWCYCTSRGYMHYDSDLYHAQSIRWIEEYGIVKGLGNIHVRFAYNSSFFALSALYSMRGIAGQSLHTVNGLAALLLSIEVAVGFKKRLALSDFARLGAFYYLTLIYRDIVAPASDYCVMCMVFYIVIRWLAYLDAEEKRAAPYGLLCVMGVYAITLKLTAGVILLLLIKPAYLLLKEKHYGEITLYLLMGLIVFAPWMIRTALISGYLLYPFPALDVLNVDWKIDAAAAALDAAEIKAWGRGLNNAALVGLAVQEWFPHWFGTALTASGKLFIAADMICIAVLTGFIIGFIIKYLHAEKRGGMMDYNMGDKLLALFAVAASYLFWQFSAPLLRYGYAYVLLLIVLTVGLVYQYIQKKGSVVIWCAAAVLLLAKAVSLAGYIAGTSDKPYYICQQDYGVYELEDFAAGGITFYYPVSGDRVGYKDFPALPRKTALRLRGRDIKSGFQSVGACHETENKS